MLKKTIELEKETQRCLEESDKLIARAEKKISELGSRNLKENISEYISDNEKKSVFSIFRRNR